MERDVFGALEAQLREADRRRDGGAALVRWRAVCPQMASATLGELAAVPQWVWSLGAAEADDVLRVLVGCAQQGDQEALLVVLVCLRPGLRALAGRPGAGVAEVVSEAALRILQVSPHRSRMAAGLVRDVRKRFWARRHSCGPECVGQRHRFVCREDPMDLRLEGGEVPPDLPAEEGDPAVGTVAPAVQGGGPVRAAVAEVRDRWGSASEELLAVVHRAWRSGGLDADDARLILETRMLDAPVGALALRWGVKPTAVYKRRARAERRLATAAA